jgi:predicted transcriptional regulator
MISIEQMKAARILAGIDQRNLADQAGVSLPTIQRMENPKFGPGRSSAANVDAVQRALEAAGVQFIAENGGGAGVRLAKPAGL